MIKETKEINEMNERELFEYITNVYLISNPGVQYKKIPEMEIRFGTGKNKQISKIDYDNTIRALYSAGFVTENPQGHHILRIFKHDIDKKNGNFIRNNIRAEVFGLDLIQEYCRSNSLQKILDLPSTVTAISDKLKFTRKTPAMEPKSMVDFTDFGFRVSYQMEEDYQSGNEPARKMMESWTDSKKTYRYLNRVRFSHPIYPIFADLSIIKSSRSMQKIQIPTHTIQEGGVFTNNETYEIELELDNTKIGVGTDYASLSVLLDSIRKTIRIVLSALQTTPYPIGMKERDQILQEYMKLIHGPNHQPRRIIPRDFIGPSSYTLQMNNILPILETEHGGVPNIRNDYSVTDKADGERRLLYVSGNGRVYMIDMNMNVIFTGTTIDENNIEKTGTGVGKLRFQDSLLDGEFIKYDKKGGVINLYMAFDIYYIHNESVRELGFIPYSLDIDEDESKKESKKESKLTINTRVHLLSEFINKMKLKSIVEDTKVTTKTKSVMEGSSRTTSKSITSPCQFAIRCKRFYSGEGTTIFASCEKILANVVDGRFEYNTDGLIFTPSHTGVGSNRIGVAGPVSKTPWEQSFKWKPPEFNTIDFLVSIKKDKKGKDEIHNIFKEGRNLLGIQDVIQFKTLILRCGFDQSRHGNLWLDMINDRIPPANEPENEEKYQAVPFQPTDPYDSNASFCNVMLKDTGGADLVMMTEEGEYFEEHMIVEFKYDISLQGAWKWIPLRVRYDKTNELRSGVSKNYGNAYNVANSNWTSIHNPVTETMITTGNEIPDHYERDDVYYNRTSKKTTTQPLRDFHNLYVKRKLIMAVSNRGDTLIDYAVGKAGDLSKWVQSKLGFVFGIDISKDNIQNKFTGACFRYINERKKQIKNPTYALFCHGNSSLNIRNGDAFMSEKDKEISRAVFGKGPKDKTLLGEGVYRQYGVASDGFQISSIQFAIHYLFENADTFHNFMRNVSECTRVGGKFIGTCYDGMTVFNALSNKNKGDVLTILRDENKVLEITKQYDQTGFPDNETSLGYAIDIYQETINKVFREYLVNFDYLIQIMENYGFVLITQAEAKNMGLPNASGMFQDLYQDMMNELNRDTKNKRSNYGVADQMTPEELRITFMNRYFVFKKIRNVNTEKMVKILHNKANKEEKEEKEEENIKKPKKIYVRKLKVPKIIIQSNTER